MGGLGLGHPDPPVPFQVKDKQVNMFEFNRSNLQDLFVSMEFLHKNTNKPCTKRVILVVVR